MKKILLTIFMGLLAFALVACNNEDDKSKSEEATDKNAKEEQAAVDPEEMQKKLDEQKVKEDQTVAIVNGQELKGAEYNNALSISQMQFQLMGQDPTTNETAKQIKDYTIEGLVGQTLLMQEIDKKGYKATEEEINKELEGLKAQYENEEAFEKAMKENNLSLDNLKKQITDTVKYGKYVKNDLKVEEVKEEEIKEYYDSTNSNQEESGEKQKYEDVKEELKLQLEQQKTQEKLNPKIEELRKSAKIELKI
jgi:hypothetical protein